MSPLSVKSVKFLETLRELITQGGFVIWVGGHLGDDNVLTVILRRFDLQSGVESSYLEGHRVNLSEFRRGVFGNTGGSESQLIRELVGLLQETRERGSQSSGEMAQGMVEDPGEVYWAKEL